MRVRCIAFVPPAALVTALLFFMTSSMVSAIESSLVPVRFGQPSSSAPFLIEVSRVAFDASVERSTGGDRTECGVLRRYALQVDGAALQCISLRRVCSASACEIIDVPIPDLSETDAESHAAPGIFLF